MVTGYFSEFIYSIETLSILAIGVNFFFLVGKYNQAKIYVKHFWLGFTIVYIFFCFRVVKGAREAASNEQIILGLFN